jgi:protein-S-isoprenylcysteine O-methyltransferase Ste14
MLWLCVGLTVGCSAAGGTYRVRVGEAALMRTLGDSYCAYMHRTWRFVPFVI